MQSDQCLLVLVRDLYKTVSLVHKPGNLIFCIYDRSNAVLLIWFSVFTCFLCEFLYCFHLLCVQIVFR